MEKDELADGDLVRAVLAGDREAFGYLYDRYVRLVRAVLYGAAQHWPTIQDMTQECFLRGYQNLGKLSPPERFGPWIVGIARNVAHERRRIRRRDRHRFVDKNELELAPDTDAAQAIQASEETECLLQRLTELPERERIAIHAFFLQECNARQTAALLDLSLSGLYAILERGLSRLASRMVHRGEKERTT